MATRDVPLVSDVKMLIKEITNLKISQWQRCLIPENNNLTTIIVSCDGSTMASSASIYLVSSPTTAGAKVSHLAVSASLFSKFSILLNKFKGTLLAIETVTNLIKVVKRHRDVNPMK